MPLTRKKKLEVLERYKETFADAKYAVLIDYQGTNVEDFMEFREKLAERKSSCVVVKNNLAKIAVADKPLSKIKDSFKGPTAVVFTFEDPVGMAKVVVDYSKDFDSIKIKSGVFEDSVLSVEEVETLAKMPSKEELIAQLVYLLGSPISRFVRTLGAIPRNLVVVLNQIKEKKEKGE